MVIFYIVDSPFSRSTMDNGNWFKKYGRGGWGNLHLQLYIIMCIIF